MNEKDKERKRNAAQEKQKTFMEKASEAMKNVGSSIKKGAQDVKTKVMGEDSKNTSTTNTNTPRGEQAGVSTKNTPFGEIKVASPVQGHSNQTNVSNSKPFSQKTEADLAMDLAKVAYQHKDAIIKVVKENPELVERGVKIATNAGQQAATTGGPDNPQKKNLQSLFGF